MVTLQDVQDKSVINLNQKIMNKINFNTTLEETNLIHSIVKRAIEFNKKLSFQTLFIDLTAVHKNDAPLNLEELLNFSDGNFMHDIYGITNYIDRNTGKLKDGFTPRSSLKSNSIDLPVVWKSNDANPVESITLCYTDKDIEMLRKIEKLCVEHESIKSIVTTFSRVNFNHENDALYEFDAYTVDVYVYGGYFILQAVSRYGSDDVIESVNFSINDENILVKA